MEAELEGEPLPDGNPNQWADRIKRRLQFHYEAYAEVERWWGESGLGRPLVGVAPEPRLYCRYDGEEPTMNENILPPHFVPSFLAAVVVHLRGSQF